MQRRDRQKKMFNKQSDYSLGCMNLVSSHKSTLTLDVTTNKYFYSAAGNAKHILKNYNHIPEMPLA